MTFIRFEHEITFLSVKCFIDTAVITPSHSKGFYTQEALRASHDFIWKYRKKLTHVSLAALSDCQRDPPKNITTSPFP
jgi:hypothetical protein